MARAAYEWALQWSKTFTSLGDRPIIHYQNVGYMLVDIAMRIEACRYLCWKAAHYLDLYDSEGHAMGAMSKVFSCELMFDTVFKCMQVVGVNAVNKEHPLERHLRDSVINPLYDEGTMGMQRRKIRGVIADADYNPTVFMDCAPVRFKKSMEGWGSVALNPVA